MKGIVGWKWLKHVETHLSPFQRTLLPGPTARPQGVWGTGHFETSLRCWAAFLSVKRDRVHQHRSALVLHVWVLDTDLWCNSIDFCFLMLQNHQGARSMMSTRSKPAECLPHLQDSFVFKTSSVQLSILSFPCELKSSFHILPIDSVEGSFVDRLALAVCNHSTIHWKRITAVLLMWLQNWSTVVNLLWSLNRLHA